MQIEYEIRDTDIGKGIYALSNISKGKLIWKYNLHHNVIEYNEKTSKKYLSKLSFLQAQNFLDITYGRGEKLCQILDDGKYMNHSDKPNCKTNMKTGNTYAICDIKNGEQLFENYATFDHPTYLLPLLKKYNCVPDYYDAVFAANLENIRLII